jgi:hypothetical protein
MYNVNFVTRALLLLLSCCCLRGMYTGLERGTGLVGGAYTGLVGGAYTGLVGGAYTGLGGW